MVTYQSFSRLTDVRITRGNGELECGGGGGGGDAAVLARDDGEGSEGTGHAIRPGTEVLPWQYLHLDVAPGTYN